MEILINEQSAGKTVKEVLTGELRVSARLLTKLKYRVENGITVNGAPVTVRYRLSVGDVLRVRTEDSEASENVLPVCHETEILYEDHDMVFVNKPAGMPTHPSHGHLDDTLANALAYRYAGMDTPFVFRPVNRLDRNTSGVVLVAKNALASSRLYRAMMRHEIRKTYLALLDGVPPEQEGVIDLALCRQEKSVILRTVCDPCAPGAMPSVTRYRVLLQNGKNALVRVFPETGRTHQIRVHFSAIGCPLVGDDLYGKASPVLARHALHAARLELIHPTTGESFTVTAPLPPDFESAVRTLLEREVPTDAGR